MLLFEFKHAIRSLWRSPWFTVSAVTMLAMGLGLVLAGFTVMQSFILRPPPYPEPDRIMHIELENTVTGNLNNALPIHTWLDMQADQTQLELFAGYSEGTINLGALGNAEDQRAQRYDGVFASADLFKVLQVQPIMGRDFQPLDGRPGAERVVMLSYQLWQHRFSAADDVLGKTVRVNGEDARIIGVMPDGFRFPRNHGIWINFDSDISDIARGGGRGLDGLGRLRSSADSNSAQVELQQILNDINRQYPDIAENDQVAVKTLAMEYVNPITRGILRAMFIAVSMVLLIACANVAGLLGARASTRNREQVIRGALGASRKRLLMKGLLEASVLAGLAAVLGLLIASGFTAWFKWLLLNAEETGPIWVTRMHFDYSTFLFAVAVAFIAALIAGWLPSWRASRVAPGSALRSGGHGSISSGLGKAGRFLVAIEIALSLTLLVSAGLIVRTVLNIQFIETGADVSQVISGRLGLFDSAYPDNTQVHQFVEQAQQDLQQIAGVTDATVATSLPMTFGGGFAVANEQLVDQDLDRLPTANEVIIADNYFAFFDVPMYAGRPFDSREQSSSEPVVIISRGLAERLWQTDSQTGVQPEAILGKRLRVRNNDGEWEYRTVIAVVGEVLNDAEDLTFGSGRPISGSYYLPVRQGQARFWSLAMRTDSSDPHLYGDELRSVIQNLDADLPVYWVRSIDDWIDNALYDHRLIAKLFAAFGVIALLLTAAGLYSLLAYSVSSQTREIGVRRALGANAMKIIRNVSHSSLVQLTIGSILGLGLALMFARLLGNILYDVSPFDPLTFISVLLLFTLVTVAASALPAMRATRIQPMEALRYE